MASMVTGTGHSSGELCSSPYLSIILQICMLTVLCIKYTYFPLEVALVVTSIIFADCMQCL